MRLVAGLGCTCKHATDANKLQGAWLRLGRSNAPDCCDGANDQNTCPRTAVCLQPFDFLRLLIVRRRCLLSSSGNCLGGGLRPD